MKQDSGATPAPQPSRVVPQRGLLVAAPLLLVLAIGAAVAGHEVVRQWRIAKVEGAAAAADKSSPALALARLTGAEQTCDGACGPRALVAGGAARALIAARMPAGSEREALAAKAADSLRSAIGEQPGSGARWAWLAVAESARGGPDHHRAALMALERSYQLAPFLRDLAVWRARFAGSDWAALDALSRERALDEIARLSLIDPDQAGEAQAAFNAPAAGLALDLRMARRGVLAH